MQNRCFHVLDGQSEMGNHKCNAVGKKNQRLEHATQTDQSAEKWTSKDFRIKIDLIRSDSKKNCRAIAARHGIEFRQDRGSDKVTEDALG